MKSVLFSPIALSLILMSCSRPELPLPAAGAGSRYPNIAATVEGGLLMSWFEPLDSVTMSIKFSEFTGTYWTKPQTAAQSKTFFVNWADFPSIVQFQGDTLALYWPEKSARGTYDYDVKVALSTDRGRTWKNPVIPHGDSGKGEHGFLSFFNDLNQNLSLVWLDGRNMTGQNENDYGEMNLYLTSFSKNLALEQELQLDSRICECCPTSAVTADNAVIIAYRDRSLDEIRNINILRFSNGKWEPPYPVFEDNWKIAGCPVNGPALEARGSQVGISWYTAADDKPKVQAAFSDNDGKTFGDPIRIDVGNPLGRVDLIWLDGESVLVSWIESGSETTNILARAVGKNGFKYPVHTVSKIDPGRISGNPKLGLAGFQIFFTWTEAGKNSRVHSEWIRKGEFF